MIRWNLKTIRYHMKGLGIENPSQLAAFARLTKPTAAKVLSGDPVHKIDAPTLEAMCRAFDLTPGDLLELRRRD